jgi:hypothetical protein
MDSRKKDQPGYQPVFVCALTGGAFLLLVMPSHDYHQVF